MNKKVHGNFCVVRIQNVNQQKRETRAIHYYQNGALSLSENTPVMCKHYLQVWTKEKERERERNVVPACGFIYRIILATWQPKKATCWSSWPIQFQRMFTGPYYRLALSYLYPSSASLLVACIIWLWRKTAHLIERFEFKGVDFFFIIFLSISYYKLQDKLQECRLLSSCWVWVQTITTANCSRGCTKTYVANIKWLISWWNSWIRTPHCV